MTRIGFASQDWDRVLRIARVRYDSLFCNGVALPKEKIPAGESKSRIEQEILLEVFLEYTFTTYGRHEISASQYVVHTCILENSSVEYNNLCVVCKQNDAATWTVQCAVCSKVLHRFCNSSALGIRRANDREEDYDFALHGNGFYPRDDHRHTLAEKVWTCSDECAIRFVNEYPACRVPDLLV
jgi:hypothetical protein